MKTGNILAIIVILLFVTLGLARLFPYENNLQASIRDDPGDDWWTYARYALDVKHNGILLPTVSQAYPGPGSFLYIYFVALNFVIFGENLIPIFILHHLMMGLSIALIYWTFKDKLKPFTGIMLLAALGLFMFLDVYKYYAIRLLGENLMIFLVPLFLFCFVKGFEKDNIVLGLLSAFLMGAIILMRANILIFALLLIPIAAYFYLKKGPRGILYLIIFILLMAFLPFLLALRNYIIADKWHFLPTGNISSLNFLYYSFPIPELDNASLPGRLDMLKFMIQNPGIFLNYLTKKILFCFGFLPLLDADYKMRPHWMVMWFGYFTYIFLFFKRKWKLSLPEITANLYILTYLGSLVIAAQVHNYGFRMLIPATGFVLVFPFLAFDKLFRKKEH